MYFDLNEIEALLDQEQFSNNLSTKDLEILKETLNLKVESQINALGMGSYTTDYAANSKLSQKLIIEKLSRTGSTQPTDIQEAGTLPTTSNGQKTWNFLVFQHNFTPEGAAGIIGNLMQESGLNPVRNQRGGGPGRGIMQWTVNQRWASLLAWAEKSGKDPKALETQLEWMIIEMKGTKYKGKSVYSYFLTIRDIDEATLLFEDTMERAGTPMMEKRYKYARQAYNTYSIWGKDSKGNPTLKNRSLNYWEEKYG